ncbi:hypothetical protein HMPREF3201_00534 [Megasphaera sp. MJR8396C]|nr:hypothetical protein HMPREF3201_00534 [Megasphaera sp. MJR8396C]
MLTLPFLYYNTTLSIIAKKKDRCIKAGLTFLRNPSYNVSYSTLTC